MAALVNDLDAPTRERARAKKLEATAIATAAWHGVAVTPIENDYGARVFIAACGAWTREIPTLDDLVAWVSRVHGKRIGAGE